MYVYVLSARADSTRMRVYQHACISNIDFIVINIQTLSKMLISYFQIVVILLTSVDIECQVV